MTNKPYKRAPTHGIYKDWHYWMGSNNQVLVVDNGTLRCFISVDDAVNAMYNVDKELAKRINLMNG